MYIIHIYSAFAFSRNLYTNAANAPPISGATINTQTTLSGPAFPPIAATIAGPKLLAGLTLVPVSPIPII